MIPVDITLAITLLVLLAVAITASSGGVATFYVLVPVLVTNRFMRRVTDWASGEYHSFPLLSILGLLAVLVALLFAIPRIWRLPARELQGVIFITAGIGYGAVRGLGGRLSTILEFLAYLAPLAMYVIVRTSNLSLDDRDRMVRTVGYFGILAAVYGLLQYAFVPPWDAFWMNHCGMHSIGLPVPFKIRVFSLLSDANIAGMFLAIACICMLLQPYWRPMGIPGVLIALCGLAVTLVRTSWLMVPIAVGFWTLKSRGSAAASRAALLVIGVITLLWVAPALPGGQAIVNRFATFGDLTSDRSAMGRADIFRVTLRASLSNPLGHGLGSTGGVMGRLSESESAAFDNGLTELLYSFGMPGLLLIGLGIWMVATSLDAQAASDFVGLRNTILVATAVGLCSLNIVKGDLACVIAMLVAIGCFTPEYEDELVWDERELQPLAAARPQEP